MQELKQNINKIILKEGTYELKFHKLKLKLIS